MQEKKVKLIKDFNKLVNRFNLICDDLSKNFNALSSMAYQIEATRKSDLSNMCPLLHSRKADLYSKQVRRMTRDINQTKEVLEQLALAHKQMRSLLKDFLKKCKKEPVDQWNDTTENEMSNSRLYDAYETAMNGCCDVIVSLECCVEGLDGKELSAWVSRLRNGLKKKEKVDLGMREINRLCGLLGVKFEEKQN